MKLRVLVAGASVAVVAATMTGGPSNGAATHGRTPAKTTAGAAARETNPGALPAAGFGPAQRAAAIAAYQNAAPSVASALGLTSGSALQVKDVVKDADGTQHVRYTRTYNGLPVVGGDLVVHNAAAGTSDVTWDKAGNFGAVDTTPSVSKAQAESAAGSNGAAKLVVWGATAQPRLAWQTTVAKANGLHRVVVTDAKTGAGIASYDLEQTADDTGTGKTLLAGTVPIKDDKNGTTYTLRDLTRGGHYVTTMSNTETTESAALTQTTNVWGNNATTNPRTVAADVQYGAAETWDFYQSLGRNGIRNDGVGARSRVHYGNHFDNAFWNDDCFCMTYGDGGGGTFTKPLVELDVAGHEMSHGVTSNSAGLQYFGESGGLNESTSDIFGTSVEFFAKNPQDAGDYYIGEKIAGQLPGGALRRMDHPSLDGGSYDCYVPGIGADDPHYSSGVGNHFFYLLAEGSGAKTIGGRAHSSPVCSGPAVVGIGRLAADRIWYRALIVYMVPFTDYASARDATIRAAADLYGKTSAQCARVQTTWNAVNVAASAYKCSGLITPPTGADVIVNGGFESTPVGWNQSRAGLIGAKGAAHTGTKHVQLRGVGTGGTDTVSQVVRVPSTGTPKLVYWLLVDTSDSASTVFDTYKVVAHTSTGDTTLQTSNNTFADDSYHRQVIDMSAFKGQSITLRFTATEDSSLQTGFYVDDVSLASY